ncbi:MAG TPA: peptide deformylase [Aggregatilineales bacterium]|nr:peptide deformylase [Aggregatilineales bacterium]
MPVRKILTLSKAEKMLRTRSEPVKKNDRELKVLIADIKATILANPAVGLAAVQIGVLKRVFGVRLTYHPNQPDEEMMPPTVFINPEIVAKSSEMENDSDACLSIPGLVGYTDRHLRLTLRYTDEEGAQHEQPFEGWDARAIQHEMDHLDGILFLDRLKTLDDLYVYVRGEDGEVQQVPYTEAVKQAEQNIDTSKPKI